MTTNIAKKALAIAKEKEIERLTMMEPEVHHAINRGFQKLLDEWTYFEGAHEFDFSQVYYGKDSEIIAVCKLIGFTAKKNPENNNGYYILSAPAITKEQESTATEAQKIILQHNEKVKERRKLEEKKAEEMCQQIAKKIIMGEFISGKSQDCLNAYEIQVEIEGYANSSEVLLRNATKLLQEMGFHNILTINDGKSWFFDVYDEG